MLSTYLIDDEHASIELLKNYVQKVPFLQLVGSTTNALEAIQLLQYKPVELIFLDIHMPHISGIDFLKLMQGRCKVVLTTASSEHAMEGFEYNALDYLLKPVSFERFLKASQKALDATGIAAAPKPAEAPPEEDNYLWVKTENKGRMIKVYFDEIMYVEGLKNYLSIHTLQERIITLMNIKDLEEYLPKSRFMRVHKSYIVAFNRIKAIDGNQIILKDMKAPIPLGETYRSSFFKLLEQSTIRGKGKP